MTLSLVQTASPAPASATLVDQNFSVVSASIGGLEARIATLESKPSGTSIYTNVKDFGAIGDGVANDTAAIASALTAARSRGGAVFFPAGTYLTSTITVQHKDSLIGESRYNTVIKQIGNNSAVIQGTNAYALFAAPTYSLTDGANQVSIQGLTVDGNRLANTTGGDGIAIWGYGTCIKDVTIRNCRNDGLSTAWTDGSVSMEGTFQNIVIDTVGYHGWRFNGPHDSFVQNFMVIDASQNADNGYNGIQVDPNGNGRFFNAHVWHRSSTTNRCWAGFNSSGACEVVASHFEGCRTQQVRHNGSGDRFVGCLIYAPFGANGTSLVVFNGNSNQHIGCAYTAGDGSITNNQVYALQIGDAVSVSGNMVSNGVFNGFSAKTPFNFYKSGGINRIDGRGWANSGGSTVFGGTVGSTDEIDYYQGGTLINYRRPQFFPFFASNAAAASAGVPVNGLYVLSATNALTVRV